MATTCEGAKKAAEAPKITYDKGPYAKVSDQTLIDEAKRLQKADGSGQLFVKKGDHSAAIRKHDRRARPFRRQGSGRGMPLALFEKAPLASGALQAPSVPPEQPG